MGSNSACVSDAARTWLEFKEYVMNLDLKDVARITKHPRQDLETLKSMCSKRVADGVKDVHFLALFLDPRPSMQFFVRDKGLLGHTT
jgi:hypothetical protein